MNNSSQAAFQPYPAEAPLRPLMSLPLGMPKNSNQSPTFSVVGTMGPPALLELLHWSSGGGG